MSKLTSDKAKEMLANPPHNKTLTSKQKRYFGLVASGNATYKSGGWLDKYDKGGEVNYNDASVSLPPNFVGMGYNTTPRRYSPAWGGQFNNGGSLPGDVGFTYARTGDIPSNGRYAKKTIASAENGTEMRYYQNGLDYIPKGMADGGTISEPLKERSDFKAWWPALSRIAAGGNREDSYGNLGDLYSYFGGRPLRHSVLENSNYKPTNSKDPNANYIAINDNGFKNQVIKKYNRVFLDKKLDKFDKQINDNTYSVSSSDSNTPRIDIAKARELYGPDLWRWHGDRNPIGAIGKYFLSKGKDEKGDYMSYYDVFDIGSGNSKDNHGIMSNDAIGTTLKLTKPFELYDRIYMNDTTNIRKAVDKQITEPKFADGGELTPLSPKDFTLDLINSPKYKERLTKSYLDESVDPEIKDRLNEVQKTKTVYGDTSGSLSKPYNYQGSNADTPYKVYIDKDQAREFKTSLPSIETHEYSHKETLNGLNPWEKKKLGNRMKQGQQYVPHDIDPFENKADINSLRQELYNKGVDVFNKDISPENIQQLKNSTNYSVKRLFQHYSDEDLLWLLNNIASTQKNDSNNISAKDGNQLTKLDQLTNFSIYDKSVKGGWLNKYS